jgi:hypothetical protein
MNAVTVNDEPTTHERTKELPGRNEGSQQSEEYRRLVQQYRELQKRVAELQLAEQRRQLRELHGRMQQQVQAQKTPFDAQKLRALEEYAAALRHRGIITEDLQKLIILVGCALFIGSEVEQKVTEALSRFLAPLKLGFR